MSIVKMTMYIPNEPLEQPKELSLIDNEVDKLNSMLKLLEKRLDRVLERNGDYPVATTIDTSNTADTLDSPAPLNSTLLSDLSKANTALEGILHRLQL